MLMNQNIVMANISNLIISRHTGERLCRVGCPLGMSVRDNLDLVEVGRLPLLKVVNKIIKFS